MPNKYNQFQADRSREDRENKARIHPIWRGVGFAFIVLIPILSYASTDLLIKQNSISHWFPVPYDIMAKPGEFLYNGDPLLYLKIALIISFMLALYAIFMLITFMVNSLFGSPRYGPYDVPPINAKVRKRAR